MEPHAPRAAQGRIQRIGQKHSTVRIYNMRYQGSIEDRVHQRLSERFGDIAALFGLIPQVLEDHWVELAKAEEQRVKVLLDHVGEAEKTALLHPFERVHQQAVDLSHWDECTAVLKQAEAATHLEEAGRAYAGKNRFEYCCESRRAGYLRHPKTTFQSTRIGEICLVQITRSRLAGDSRGASRLN
ncbi:hypothetical protein [Deinococcus cavernae]|uniref:hypothetical protein n=1 Tax=Deinococcus cavernae TaxID=2320857 RepID=UPI001F223216|nr:hypothetical protein [Deinococcus cavernae]